MLGATWMTGDIPRGVRLPLAALRWRLDAASVGAQWSVDIDGVLGRSLLMPAGATVTWPLRLEGEAVFAARAMLLPHDWGSGRGGVRARVTVTDPAGTLSARWAECAAAAGRA